MVFILHEIPKTDKWVRKTNKKPVFGYGPCKYLTTDFN